MARRIRRRLAALVVAVSAFAGVAPTSGATADATTPDWLARVNAVRTAAGLNPVTERTDWEAGLAAHLRYLKLTPPSYMTGAYASMHTENPASPYYTADGEAAGGSSDLTTGSADAVGAVDEWLAAPFHAIGILRPELTQIAFYRDPDTGSAGLDVIRGLNGAAPSAAPVLFPGSGSHIDLTRYSGGEYPSPLESCSLSGGAGLPLIALLPAAPALGLTAELTDPAGTTVSDAAHLCVVDEHTYRTTDTVYGPTGAAILAGDHAVFLIPSAPLRPGAYTAAIHQPGLADVAWSFTVDVPKGPHKTSMSLSLSSSGPVAYGSRLTARVRVRDEVTGAPATTGTVWMCIETAVSEPCLPLQLTATGWTRTVAVKATRQVRFLAALDDSPSYSNSSAVSAWVRVATGVSARLASGRGLAVQVSPAARIPVRLQRLVPGRWVQAGTGTTTAQGAYVFRGLGAHMRYRVVVPAVSGRTAGASAVVLTP